MYATGGWSPQSPAKCGGVTPMTVYTTGPICTRAPRTVVRRPEEQPVHDAEHRRVGADAESNGRDHADGEAWLHAQAAERVLEVLAEALEGHVPMTPRGGGALTRLPLGERDQLLG